MNVILYTNSSNEIICKRLQEAVESKVSPWRLQTYQTIKELYQRVHKLPREIYAAVLLAQNDEQLLELVSLRELLDGINIILVLQNCDKVSINKSHLLMPRFIDYSDGHNVAGVLEKIMARKDMKEGSSPI